MKIKLSPAILEALDASLYESETADALLNDVFFRFKEKELKSLESCGDIQNGYRQMAIRNMDQEQKEAYASVQVGYGLDSFDEIDPESLLGNPYYKALSSLKGTKKGKSEFLVKGIPAHSLFVYDEVKTDPANFLASYSPVGYFKKPFPYPCIDREGRTWMSIIPHEANTMAKAIEKAHGNVLTYGCGLGYFAFMASIKEGVDSVTILESDPNALALFRDVLLPLFPKKEKINLIQGNALKFSLEEGQKPYDYLFVDIYHDAEDGLPLYIELRKREEIALEADYWIEEAILAYFRRHLISYVLEQADGYGDEAYKGYENFSERLLCSLHRHYKHAKIETAEELLSLLSSDNLRELAQRIKLIG